MPTSAPTAKADTAPEDTSAANGKTSEEKTPESKTYSLEEIQKLLPHRYPFAMIDRIIDYVPGERATGLKNVTFNEPHFQGHFPGKPLMPGVLIVEAMAQVGGIVLSQMPSVNGLCVFAGHR